MSKYYNEPLIHVALSKALGEQFNNKDIFEEDYFFIVCLKPYHVNSHPITLYHYVS
jgi:hypothetical protein